MENYNINKISKLVTRLESEVGIMTEKDISNMKFEDLEKLNSYTVDDIKTLIILRKIIAENKNSLFLFFKQK